MLEKMGYWQKESEFVKKVGCFKASLGSLGLIENVLGNSSGFFKVTGKQIHTGSNPMLDELFLSFAKANETNGLF